jgi:hypothetical protein
MRGMIQRMSSYFGFRLDMNKYGGASLKEGILDDNPSWGGDQRTVKLVVTFRACQADTL